MNRAMVAAAGSSGKKRKQDSSVRFPNFIQANLNEPTREEDLEVAVEYIEV